MQEAPWGQRHRGTPSGETPSLTSRAEPHTRGEEEREVRLWWWECRPLSSPEGSQEPQDDNTLYSSETQRHPPGCDPESRTTSLHPQTHSQGQGLPPPSLIQASGRRPHQAQGSRRSLPGKGSVLVIRGSHFWEKTAPELSFSPTGTVNDPKRLQR